MRRTIERMTFVTDAPHFWVGIDSDACSNVIVFDLEFRYGGGPGRYGQFSVRIGRETMTTFIDSDFESASGWTSDPGTTTRGAFVREDPIGVEEDQNASVLTQPEDDTTPDPGNTCWVTGNGNLQGPNKQDNNDVDDGTTTLTSSLFGEPHILELNLSYDRWYYANAGGGDSFFAEISNDGGMNWVTVEQEVFPTGGWETQAYDLMTLIAPSATMQLRFRVTDGSDDTTVESAVDEVHIDGKWVDCTDFTPPAALPPNTVGDTLVASRQGRHVALSWQAPPSDGSHDPATLYRVERATVANGTLAEVGSSTTIDWFDIDAATTPLLYYYLVTAENAGGGE